MRARLLCLLFLALPLTLPAQQPTSEDPLQHLLDSARHRSQLQTADAQPFHLVATFQQFAPDGSPAGHGTLDQLWQSPTRYRQLLTLPALTTTTRPDGSQTFGQDLKAPPRTLLEIDNGQQLWRTGQQVIFSEPAIPLLQPFASLPQDAQLTRQPVPAGAPQLDCIGSEPTLPGVPPETPLAFTTWCLAPGNHLLKLILDPNGRQTVFSDIQPFGEKYIARSIQVTVNGRLRLRIHVETLETPTSFETIDQPIPPDAQRLPFHRANLPHVTGELMVGQLLTHVSPLYPQGRLPGFITVKLHIDTQGNIESTDILSSDNQILKAPVLAAVRQWKFRVSYSETQPVAVDHIYRFDLNGDTRIR